MSFTIGAALKKIAVRVFLDPKALKHFGMIVLICLLVIMMPIAAVTAIFTGTVEIDSGKLTELVLANLSDEDRVMLMQVEETMNGIDAKMKEKGFGAHVKEAQVLYLFALYDQSSEPDFIDRLVGCFSDDVTDMLLIARVNSTFHTMFTNEEFDSLMNCVNAVAIETYDYVSPETKNSADLVKWAEHAYKGKWGYVWGTYGDILTRSYLAVKLEQYPDEVGSYKDFIIKNWLGRRTVDCVGLIKSYGWLNAQTAEIEYGANGMPDVSANDMYYNASEKGDISTMPEIPGLAVWHQGHIGVYIGDGWVIEAMGTEYGIKKTRLVDRHWTHWLKIPYISYEPIEESGGDVIIDYEESGGYVNIEY